MDKIKLEGIIQNFISIIPLFKKKLLHDSCKFDKGNLNHSHFQILTVLKNTVNLLYQMLQKNFLYLHLT